MSEEIKVHPSGKSNAGKASFKMKMPTWMKEVAASFKKDGISFGGSMLAMAGMGALVVNPMATGACGVVAAGMAITAYGDSKRNNGSLARRFDKAVAKLSGPIAKKLKTFASKSPMMRMPSRER